MKALQGTVSHLDFILRTVGNHERREWEVLHKERADCGARWLSTKARNYDSSVESRKYEDFQVLSSKINKTW